MFILSRATCCHHEHATFSCLLTHPHPPQLTSNPDAHCTFIVVMRAHIRHSASPILTVNIYTCATLHSPLTHTHPNTPAQLTCALPHAHLHHTHALHTRTWKQAALTRPTDDFLRHTACTHTHLHTRTHPHTWRGRKTLGSVSQKCRSNDPPVFFLFI